MTKLYAFINSDNIVQEYQVFEDDVSTDFLELLNTEYGTKKFVLDEERTFGGVGCIWDEEHKTLYPPLGDRKNMIWNFIDKKYVPVIEKPEGPEDISQGEWVWDPFAGEWVFTEPNGMPPLE